MSQCQTERGKTRVKLLLNFAWVTVGAERARHVSSTEGPGALLSWDPLYCFYEHELIIFQS